MAYGSRVASERRSRKCEVENESLRQTEIGREMQARRPQKHHTALAKRGCLAFRASVDYMVPPPAPPARLVTLFDERATLGMIRHWMYGRSVPPLWAIELLASKIRARVAPGLAIADALQTIRKPGNRGARALAAWRERKARERTLQEQIEKEKAANAAALPTENLDG